MEGTQSEGRNGTSRRQTRSIGRAVGVANYSREDLNAIMTLVENLRPAGKNGWNRLTKKYNALVNQKRHPDCLRRKFLSLVQPKSLSSKQEAIAGEILERAKRIHREITSGNNISMDLENDDVAYDSQDSENDVNLLPSQPLYGTSQVMTGTSARPSDIRGINELEGLHRLSRLVPDGYNMNHYGNSSGIDSNTVVNGNGTISNNSISNGNSELLQAIRQNFEAIAGLNALLSSFVSQSHRQHEELVGALNAHHRTFQQQFQNYVEIQRQQTATITSVLSGFILAVSSTNGQGHDNSFPGSTNILSNSMSLGSGMMMDPSMGNILSSSLNNDITFLQNRNANGHRMNITGDLEALLSQEAVPQYSNVSETGQMIYDGSGLSSIQNILPNDRLHNGDSSNIQSRGTISGSNSNKRKLDELQS